jgi:hypothetical protein
LVKVSARGGEARSGRGHPLKEIRGFMSVRLELDDFGKEALEAQVRSGSSRDAFIRTAARYYLADRGSGRVSWQPPRFLRRDARRAPAVTEVELDEETMKALEEEARRHSLSAARLAEHALLYYLADLDSGRAAARVRDALEGHDPGDLRRQR